MMECDHREKGEGKRTIFRYFIFLDGSFRSVLPYEGTTFRVNARLYVNFMPYGNTFSSILFCFVLCTKSLQ